MNLEKVDARGKPIPEGLKPVRDEPGVFKTPSGRRVDGRGRPIPKDQQRGPPIDSEKPFDRPIPEKGRFCDWLLGRKPEKRPTERDVPPSDRRIPSKGLRPVKGEPGVYTTPSGRKVDSRGRPIPEGLKPVKGEPGVFQTPSGRKVDSRGRPIPEGLKPVRDQPGVYTTPSGRKVDSRGRPIPEGLKPVKGEPGVFQTPSGRKVDSQGRPISEGQKPVKDEPRGRPAPRDQPREAPTDSGRPQRPEKGGFCDWLLGRKPEKQPIERDIKPSDRRKSAKELKPVKEEPGVYITPSGRKVDSRGRPIPEGLKPVQDELGVSKTPSGRRVDGRGRPVPRDQPREPPVDSGRMPERQVPEKGRFCDWLLGRKPEKRPTEKEVPPHDGRQPSKGLRPVKGEPGVYTTPSGRKVDSRGRPIPEGLKPVKGEPGVFQTPSGRKVDSRGRPIPEGLKPVRDQPGVYTTPSGRKVDSRGRPIPEGLKPVKGEPGVFTTPSGRRVDGRGRPVPRDETRKPTPRDQGKEPPIDSGRPQKGGFCDWLLGRKPEDRKRPRDGSIEPDKPPKVRKLEEKKKPSKPTDKSAQDILKDFPSEKFDVDDCEEFIRCVQSCLKKHRDAQKRKK
ncbi:hypothetical protein M8J75_014244 [Diaphorina citri]|nr:hypothetical protein M8J75_014244 [Diaphorina citri]